MPKFPVHTRQMTEREHLVLDARKQALKAADGNKDRVIIVDDNTYLVINRPGFNPYNWPKTDWRK